MSIITETAGRLVPVFTHKKSPVAEAAGHHVLLPKHLDCVEIHRIRFLTSIQKHDFGVYVLREDKGRSFSPMIRPPIIQITANRFPKLNIMNLPENQSLALMLQNLNHVTKMTKAIHSLTLK